MNQRAAWIAGTIVVVLIVIIALLWPRGGHEAAPPPPSVSVVTARSGMFDVRVQAQGRIGSPAGSSSNLSFAVPGIIRSIDVRVGQRVAMGDALARLDDTSFVLAARQALGEAEVAASNFGGGTVPSAALQSAEARVRVAKDYLDRLEGGGPASSGARADAVGGIRQADLRVDADRRELARAEALYAGGIVAQKDVDAAHSQLAADVADAQALRAKSGTNGSGASGVIAQARADYAQALADLRNAQAQAGSLRGQAARAQAALAQAQSDEAKTVLRAPMDGVIIRIDKHPGESADMTTPVVEIGPGNDAAATLFVPASDARDIKVGDRVELYLMRSAASAVASVSAVVPAVDPTTQETTVVVSAAPADAVPGDAVRGVITVAHRPGILVPATAIVQDPQTGKTLVFVSRRGRDGFDAREVTVIGSDEKTADIGSGLKAGEEVAARGAYELLSPTGN